MNFFFQNLNIRTRPKITEPEHKISESDPKCRNTRTGTRMPCYPRLTWLSSYKLYIYIYIIFGTIYIYLYKFNLHVRNKTDSFSP